MKVRDGFWTMADGLLAEYAEEVYSVTPVENGVQLLCPTKKIWSRGDTLNTPTITVTIKAEMEGVLSVEAVHWAGAQRKGPELELFPAGKPTAEGQVSKDDKTGDTTVTAGSLAATVSGAAHTFQIRFHPADASPDDIDAQLTSLEARSVGYAVSPVVSSRLRTEDMRDKTHHMFTQSELGVGEGVYGLGERFGAFNKVGQEVKLWNADGGTSSEQAYKNVSFWLSGRGYGVLVDTPGKVELEVGSACSNRVETVVEGQRLRWLLVAGPSPKDVLRRLSVLAGQAPSVPSWSLGLWLTTSFTTDYDENTVRGFLTGMRKRNIAVDVFHYDCFWMRAFAWTDFLFDSERFPDPAGQIARLKADGLCRKVCVWINPYIAQHGEAFAHAAKHGYLLKRPNGDAWQWDLWQAGMALVDFTNPEACEWYAKCLEGLLDLGVDAFKTDFGERIPTTDVQWHDRSVDPERMHNFYAHAYNKVVHDVLVKRFGEGEAVLFARSACLGGQRFPVHWGGDCESTPAGMAQSIRGGLSLGLCGFAYWSVDIGGFEGAPPPWIYKRWVAWGLLCSHSRLHGSNAYRVPWLVDDDDQTPSGCSATVARWSSLKTRLVPYLLAQAQASRTAGLPVSLRAMLVEFPEDPTSWNLDRQFLLGDRLLVAPVFSASGHVEFYLPAGKWTNFFTNETRQGPGWFREHHGFASLPLYVRENTILVLGPAKTKNIAGAIKEAGEATEADASSPTGAVYDYISDVEVVLYHVQPGAQADVVSADGSSLGRLHIDDDGKLVGTDVFTGNVTVSNNERVLDDAFATEGVKLL
ncbi:hypothetical protein SEUCBS139899_010865 [Sporothrix eucalyptigena]